MNYLNKQCEKLATQRLSWRTDRPKLSKRTAYKVWRYFNEEYFGGELSDPKISLYKRLYYSYEYRGQKKKAPLWGAYNGELNWLFLSCGKPYDWTETLFHEMCHQFDYEVLLADRLDHRDEFWRIYQLKYRFESFSSI